MFQEKWCYWPKTDIGKKLKDMDLPDKRWKSYLVKVLKNTGKFTFIFDLRQSYYAKNEMYG